MTDTPTNPADSVELLADCPFCGEKPIEEDPYMAMLDGRPEPNVACPNLHTMMMPRAAWNTRLSAEKSASEGWRSIESAPRDGTQIDLWSAYDNGGTETGERLTFCRWRNESCTYDAGWHDCFGNKIEWVGEDGCSRRVTHWSAILPSPGSSSASDGTMVLVPRAILEKRSVPTMDPVWSAAFNAAMGMICREAQPPVDVAELTGSLVVVPREPTGAMIEAYWGGALEAGEDWDGQAREAWSAMVRAATSEESSHG